MQIQKLPRGIYVLLLLNANEAEPVKDRTRLAKLIFLISKEVLNKPGRKITTKNYTFRADRFGPFTEEIYDDVDTLLDLGLLRWEDRQILRITEKGKELLDRLIQSNQIPFILLEDIEKIKQRYNHIPLKKLLRFVYRKYGKYTHESEIRDEILGI